MLVSAVQQSESAICIHISPLWGISSPFRLPQGTEQGSNENVIHWNPLGATTEGYVNQTRVDKAIADGHLEAGITAWTVTGVSQKPGSSEQIPHAWNVVWLDADTCVYTDVTWDDQNPVSHLYFGLTDAEIKKDHRWDMKNYPATPRR